MATLTIELPAQVTQGQMIAMLDSIGCDLRLATDGRNYRAVPRGARTLSHDRLKRIAEAHREAWGHRGGYVMLFKGEAVGWKRCLDRPEGFEPGALAVDENGHVWEATGGNAYDGASRWSRVRCESNVLRMPARVRAVRQPTPPGAA